MSYQEIKDRANETRDAGVAEGKTAARIIAMGHSFGIIPLDERGVLTSIIRSFKIRDGVVDRVLAFAERKGYALAFDPQTKTFTTE